MPTNRVNATLPPEDKDAVLAALKLVREKLPFLITLSKKDRKKLAAMGDTRYSFVHRALEVAKQCPDILPRNFSVEDYGRDVALLDALRLIVMDVRELNGALDDTSLELGAEAYASARKVYHAVKNDSRGMGLDETKKDLGKIFSQKKPRKTKKPQEADSGA